GVYEIGRNFRNEGMDRSHNPEFTCMELYVQYKDYNWMMGFTEQIIQYDLFSAKVKIKDADKPVLFINQEIRRIQISLKNRRGKLIVMFFQLLPVLAPSAKNPLCLFMEFLRKLVHFFLPSKGIFHHLIHLITGTKRAE
ncbi:MAG: hypothetical protein J6Q02_02925, partial [Lachnospiraceae bacterium]|nr:hypothetical protein [Lachnospiraceae bacterium]